MRQLRQRDDKCPSQGQKKETQRPYVNSTGLTLSPIFQRCPVKTDMSLSKKPLTIRKETHAKKNLQCISFNSVLLKNLNVGKKSQCLPLLGILH